MQVSSTCPQCRCQWGWTANQIERTADGGKRPARSPNCPKCGYDVTGTNERAPRNFHFYAKTNDVEGMQQLTAGARGAAVRPAQADLNARVEGESFNPLVVAAIYGSAQAAGFLLDHGADRAQIPLALAKAKEFGHATVARLLEERSKTPDEGVKPAAIHRPAAPTPATMPIQVTCVCGKSLRAPESAAGKKAKCPACGASLVVPGASTGRPAGEHLPAPRGARLRDLEVAPAVLDLVPEAVARENGVLPIRRIGGAVLIAVPDLSRTDLIEKLRFILNMEIKPLLAGADEIAAEIERRYAALPKPAVKTAEPAPARSPVAVIGDPGHGLEKVVALFNKLGIKTGKLGEGPTVQPVVVAMAGHDGPSEKFRAALITSATHAVRVLGIVYTSVHDDDMQEMIEDVIRDSVVHFVPGTDPQLPSWWLEDPKLPTTITGLLKSSPDLAKLRSAVKIVPGPKPYVEPKPPAPPKVVKKQGPPIAGPESWRKVPCWTSSTAMKQSMNREAVSLTDPTLEFLIQYFNSSNNRNPENAVAIGRLVQALAKLNRGDFATAGTEIDGILQTAGLAKELVSKAFQCRGILRTIHGESHAAIEDFAAAMEQDKDDMNLAWSLLWRGRAHARAGFREAAGADFQIVAGMEKLKQLPYTEAIRAAAESDLRAVR